MTKRSLRRLFKLSVIAHGTPRPLSARHLLGGSDRQDQGRGPDRPRLAPPRRRRDDAGDVIRRAWPPVNCRYAIRDAEQQPEPIAGH